MEFSSLPSRGIFVGLRLSTQTHTLLSALCGPKYQLALWWGAGALLGQGLETVDDTDEDDAQHSCKGEAIPQEPGGTRMGLGGQWGGMFLEARDGLVVVGDGSGGVLAHSVGCGEGGWGWKVTVQIVVLVM